MVEGNPVVVGLHDISGFEPKDAGKAFAAYLKPREQGAIKVEPADEIADVVKTFGHVAEYWLSDPQRATAAALCDTLTSDPTAITFPFSTGFHCAV